MKVKALEAICSVLSHCAEHHAKTLSRVFSRQAGFQEIIEATQIGEIARPSKSDRRARTSEHTLFIEVIASR